MQNKKISLSVFFPVIHNYHSVFLKISQIFSIFPVFLFFSFNPVLALSDGAPHALFLRPQNFLWKEKKPALPLKRDGEKSRIIPVRANCEKDAVVRPPPRFPSVLDQEAPARA